ncbi:hypothetical protein [Actinomadura hibisca]|uniref:hypothetical protein n=1 Tax=Actinomadura hibisca TaxID=68565 RepID=UPI00082B5ED6|nr:hypothetical protein [Actinomadura hibisca]
MRQLDELRVVLHRQDPAVYARLDRAVPEQPRVLVGSVARRVVTVTPPLNGQDAAVFRWGRWGGQIAPVTMPEVAAAAILAEVADEHR